MEERRKSQEFAGPIGAKEEGVLKEMLNSTNKTIAEGEEIVQQARLSVQKCKEKSEKIDSAHNKLELISTEIDKQYQVVSQLLVQLRMRNDGFQRTVSNFEHRQDEIHEGLEQIFVKLRERKLNSALYGASGNRTLYDFVDNASIQRLEKQTTKEVNEMKETHERVRVLIKALEDGMAGLSSKYKNAEIRVDHRLAYPTEKTSLQLNEVNAMGAIMLSITAHSDHITHLLKVKDTRPQHVDLIALQRRTDQLPSSIAILKNRLQRVSAITQQTEERYGKYSTAFRDAVALYEQFQRFSEMIRPTLQELDEAESAFEERRISASSLFEELSNLSTWYDLFHTAYEELLIEIDRRHSEQRRQQEVIDAYQEELDYWYEVESKKRSNFFDFYGRYLPQSMCPAIMENANRYEIYPRNPVTRLPVLQQDERDNVPAEGKK